MNFYHLVTRVPMTEGQIIAFTNENHNRLYDFWMKHEARRKDGPAFIGDASLLPDLNGDSFDENKVFEIYVKSADAGE